MQQLTYRQAYDKIIDAYFKDEIKPNNPMFCFCGTLNNNSGSWCHHNGGDLNKFYLPAEYASMESAVLEKLIPFGAERYGKMAAPGDWFMRQLNTRVDGYEDALFEGMCAALEVLKQIHRDRGENVDEEIPVFTKRQLVKAH